MLYIDIDDDYCLSTHILSAMYFPSDKNLRESFISNSMANSKIKNQPDSATLNIDVGTLKILTNSPSNAEMKKLTSKAFKNGTLAGDLLSFIYLMDLHNMDAEPSINKAIYALQNFSLLERYGDDTILPRGDQTIKKAWKNMKPSAHLWAAFRLIQSHPSYILENAFASRENILFFLQVSATLLNFGTSFTPIRKNESIMNLADCFQLPSEIMDKPYVLEINKYPDYLKNLLNNYKAPKSHIYD